jgi:hypothetical protein
MGVAKVTDVIKRINDVYESCYIIKSVFLCKDVEDMYSVKRSLEMMDYPVEVMTIDNTPNVVAKFERHMLRMIMVHYKFYDMFKHVIDPATVDLYDFIFIERSIPNKTQLLESLATLGANKKTIVLV